MQYLLSFPGYDLSHHLRHVDAKRAESIEGLLALLYDRVDDIFSRPDLAKHCPGGRLRRRRGGVGL